MAFLCQAVISWSAREGEKTLKMKIAWSPSGPQSSQGAVAATCFWRDFCNGAASMPISEVLRKLEMNPSKRKFASIMTMATITTDDNIRGDDDDDNNV